MQHEQVNEKTVALSIRGAKLTGRMLAKAMRAFIKKSREPTVKHGKQSIKSLTKQGASLTDVEIPDGNIGAFKKLASKYNIDFALKKDDAKTPPGWIVFFKAKDSKSLDSAFKEYYKATLQSKTRKPSMIKRLRKFVELAKSVISPVKNRERGER